MKWTYKPVQAKTRAWWDELHQIDQDYSGAKAVQVFEDDNDIQPTGLLDAQGNELFRIKQRHAIGFKWSDNS